MKKVEIFLANRSLIKSIGIFFLVIITFLLSFQYFFLADFPIGPDVVNHIAHEVYLDKIGYLKAFTTFLYPLSLILFNIYHKLLAIFGFTWEKSFIFVLCLNVFTVSILTGILASKIFNDWRVGVLASILLASSRWINDSMRIGLLGESFGWILLVISLLLLFDKKWKLLIPSAFILFFCHPMVFGIFMVFLLIVLIYLAIWGERKDKKAARFFLFTGFILAILFFSLKITLFKGIIDIAHLKFEREGERSLLNFVTDSDKRRVFIYATAFLGFVFSLMKLRREQFNEKILFLIFFTIFSFIVCFKHLLGVHFLSYRFYTYFEIAVAICGGYGVLAILGSITTSKKAFIISLPLSVLLVFPNWNANSILTKWQLTDFNIGSTTPTADRQVIAKTSKIIKPNSRVIGANFWGYWYLSKINGGYTMDPILYSDSKSLYNYLYRNDINYVFCSSLDKKGLNETSSFLRLIYQKDGARLYEFVK